MFWPVIEDLEGRPKPPVGYQEPIYSPIHLAFTGVSEPPRSVGTFQRRALLIGINGYSQNPLDGCLNDVHAFHRVLTKHYGFFSNDTTIITDHTPQLPTRANILRALWELARDTEENDCLVVYYAGHGTRYSGSVYSRAPAVQEDVVDAICPIDRGTIANGEMVMDISSRDFDAVLSEVRANVTVILDCCHGGTFIDVLSCRKGKIRYTNSLPAMGRTLFQVPPVLPAVLHNASRVFLSACTWYEIALECRVDRGNETHGVFTQGLLDALELDVDHTMTYEDLMSQIGPLPSQTPVIRGNGITSGLWDIPRAK